MLQTLFIHLLLYVIAHHSDNCTNTRYMSQPGRQRHPGHDAAISDSSHRYPDTYEDANTYVANDYKDTSAAWDSENYRHFPDTVGNTWSNSSPPNDDNPYETLENRSPDDAASTRRKATTDYTQLNMYRYVEDDDGQTDARY